MPNATKRHDPRGHVYADAQDIPIAASAASWRDTISGTTSGFRKTFPGGEVRPMQSVIIVHNTAGGGTLTVAFETGTGVVSSPIELRDGSYLASDDFYLGNVTDLKFTNGTGVAVNVEVIASPETD